MYREIRMLLRWARMLSGRSYYHQPQGLGRAFRPGSLEGYFNDLTAKTLWKGEVDPDGIPIVKYIDGRNSRKEIFIGTVVQKALGHNDRFVITGDCGQKEEFLKICRWLVEKQDSKGGWEVGDMTEKPFRYSAMSQGEAVSALARAWRITGDGAFIDAAGKAYGLLVLPLEQKGTVRINSEGVFFEEYPSLVKNTVLNGWIFALFGVYDYHIATGDGEAREMFDSSVKTMVGHIGGYDCGFWSYYNDRGDMASPFYHHLHVNQLKALVMVTGDRVLAEYQKRWSGYYGSHLKKMRAFAIKAGQKLKNMRENAVVE